jgi:FkbM family methyltransferase
MLARKEEPNEMSTNGELRLQRLVIDSIPFRSKIVAFDVGARIGDWSKAFVDRAAGRPGSFQLHAFEPVHDSRKKLQETLAQQVGVGEVLISGFALSNESIRVPIYVPTTMGGTSTLYPESTINYEQVLEVETSTIDQYCIENSIEHIDLIKIDTEGNDLRVIQGAVKLLRTGKVGVVQFEYNHRWIYSRSYLKDVFDLVRNTPYRIAKVCASALEVYVEWHPELERFFEANYALVHNRLMAPLKCVFYRIGSCNSCEPAEEVRGDAFTAHSIRKA